MNWTIEKINDRINSTIVEDETRPRRLNYYALLMKNYKQELPRVSPSQRLQWQRDNSPPSLPNIHDLSNNQIIVLRRRVSRSTNNMTLVSQFNMLKNAHADLSHESLVAWKNRSIYLSQRDPHVDVLMNNGVLKICDSEMQMQIFDYELAES